MKAYLPQDIRNFAIVGHATSGKTMLSEAMLACAGVINRMGSISAGSTVSDYHDNEQQRQISVSATLMHMEWLGKKFNVLDCPGYSDFISEGLGARRVGDFALIVVHANHGVGVGTDAVWKYATEDGIPKMIVINAFDKEETDFERTLTQIREHFGERVFPLNLPINAGPGFNQMLDVPRSEIITTRATERKIPGKATGRGPNAWNCTSNSSNLSPNPMMLLENFRPGWLSEEEFRGHSPPSKQVFPCSAPQPKITSAFPADGHHRQVGSSRGPGKGCHQWRRNPAWPHRRGPGFYVFKTMVKGSSANCPFSALFRLGGRQRSTIPPG
jgi:elongation factor G